jgi:nucleoid DNA-binding protein
MNLKNLVHEVWKDPRTKQLKIKKTEVKILVEVVIDQIGYGLLRNGFIKIQNLFTLDIRKAKGRKIGNPRTHKPMKIQDYYKIGITPSKRLREGLKNFKE